MCNIYNFLLFFARDKRRQRGFTFLSVKRKGGLKENWGAQREPKWWSIHLLEKRGNCTIRITIRANSTIRKRFQERPLKWPTLDSRIRLYTHFLMLFRVPAPHPSWIWMHGSCIAKNASSDLQKQFCFFVLQNLIFECLFIRERKGRRNLWICGIGLGIIKIEGISLNERGLV